MVVADTSAWVEFLRDTKSAVCEAVDHGLRDDSLAVSDAVVMEILAGARDEIQLKRLERLLARATLIVTESTHFTTAAALYRACRLQGETVRSMVDCLVAAVTIDAGLPLLHADRDFDVLARHTPLRVAR